MEPGAWRRHPAQGVAVGRHVPPSSQYVADLMAYFHRRFAFDPAPNDRLLGSGKDARGGYWRWRRRSIASTTASLFLTAMVAPAG